MIKQITQTYREFPPKFWIVIAISFIDLIGATLLFPFFSLYATQKFGIGMAQAGVMLGLSSFFGLLGVVIGGALTDKFGRKKIIIIGLIFSAISSITIGLVDNLIALFPLIIFTGLLSQIAGPAQRAMIADLLPKDKRQEGFSILRVTGNISWLIGPTIAGFVASKSFLALFITDAVISILVALMFFWLIPETKPDTIIEIEKHGSSFWQTAAGYGKVLRDTAFMGLMLASILMMLVYVQLYNSLSVFLRDNHGVDAQGYGSLLSTSAVTVILFQFWITRRIKNKPPFIMMAIGAFFYALGFFLFGIVDVFVLFALNVIIITIGEMIVAPSSEALATNFAPADMRGRYMAIYGLTWSIPLTIGPGLAGILVDSPNPDLLWYIGGGLCLVSVFGYLVLHERLGQQARFMVAVQETLPSQIPE